MAQDFHPFGSVMNGRSFSNEGYRFGFNGKELDNETFTDAYDYGARILDTRLGRWLSVDPLQSKYPSLSCYQAMNNSPILFLDADGKENIIYLIVLPSAMKSNGGQFTITDLNKMVQQVNENFRNLGLETRMAVFNKTISENRFDVTKIAKTDAVTVIGSASKVQEYIKQKDAHAGKWLEKENWTETEQPEKSQNPTNGRKGVDDKWIAINSDFIGKNSNADLKKGVNSSFPEYLPLTKAQYASTSITHGLGHNAGMQHSFGIFNNSNKSSIMKDAEGLSRDLWFNYKDKEIMPAQTLRSNLNYGKNKEYINAVKQRCGDECVKDEKPIKE
jgi:RHS repeat-associated protein